LNPLKNAWICFVIVGVGLASKLNRNHTGARRHPRTFGATEIVALLDHLAKGEDVSAAKPNQALNVRESATVYQRASRGWGQNEFRF
jgi:hypothetical protein